MSSGQNSSYSFCRCTTHLVHDNDAGYVPLELQAVGETKIPTPIARAVKRP